MKHVIFLKAYWIPKPDNSSRCIYLHLKGKDEAKYVCQGRVGHVNASTAKRV